MFTVKWAGRYAEDHDTLEGAQKFARLILGTVAGWAPDCRELHDHIRIFDGTREVDSFSVEGEMKRLAADRKANAPVKPRKRRERTHP